MVKYCPSCGTKLDQEFNFCPSCGFDLQKISETKSKEEEQKEISEPVVEKIIICDNCGEENSAGNEVCIYCGVPLKGKSTEKVIQEKPVVKAKADQPQKKQVKQKQTGSKSQPNQKTKELDQKKMFLILGVVVIAILIILWSSGVLSSANPDRLFRTR